MIVGVDGSCFLRYWTHKIRAGTRTPPFGSHGVEVNCRCKIQVGFFIVIGERHVIQSANKWEPRLVAIPVSPE